MNEIERALVTLQDLLDNSIFTSRIDFALEVAIEALREQAERGKGCEYCRGNVKELVDGDTTIFINHEDKVFYADWSGNDYLDWKHCPMCGRRLEVEP
jgi:plasmid stabilization system protein ParE